MTESFLSAISIKDLLYHSKIKSYNDSAEARHKLVMSLFPQHLGSSPRSKAEILFRFETIKSGAKYSRRCLIRSLIAPVNFVGLNILKEDFNESLKKESKVIFRVTASPIKRSGKKEFHLNDLEAQEEWVANKLQGALTVGDILNIDKEEIFRKSGHSSGPSVTLAQFDGIAVVDNLDNLVSLVRKGVGRNKAYGAGLMTVRRLR